MLTRLRLSGFLALAALSALVPASGWTQAVSVDATSLVRRLDAIEKRLGTVESQRAARSSGSALVPMSASAGTYSVNDLEQRLGDLENEVSQQSGGSDRVQFAIEKLAKRFDDFSKDMDLRLNDIEGRLHKVEGSSVAAVAPAAAPVAVAPGPAAASATASAAAPAEKKTTSAVAATAAVPAGLSAADLYNKAYAYMGATDYANAQLWLTEFVKRYPKDKLADNAWYWLGEVQLVQNNPSGAVVSFRNGLQAFPKGQKAPGNLYKMGVALDQLKQPALAKGAWEKLMKDYPASEEAKRAKEKLVLLKKPAA